MWTSADAATVVTTNGTSGDRGTDDWGEEESENEEVATSADGDD